MVNSKHLTCKKLFTVPTNINWVRSKPAKTLNKHPISHHFYFWCNAKKKRNCWLWTYLYYHKHILPFVFIPMLPYYLNIYSNFSCKFNLPNWYFEVNLEFWSYCIKLVVAKIFLQASTKAYLNFSCMITFKVFIFLKFVSKDELIASSCTKLSNCY